MPGKVERVDANGVHGAGVDQIVRPQVEFAGGHQQHRDSQADDGYLPRQSRFRVELGSCDFETGQVWTEPPRGTWPTLPARGCHPETASRQPGMPLGRPPFRLVNMPVTGRHCLLELRPAVTPASQPMILGGLRRRMDQGVHMVTTVARLEFTRPRATLFVTAPTETRDIGLGVERPVRFDLISLVEDVPTTWTMTGLTVRVRVHMTGNAPLQYRKDVAPGTDAGPGEFDRHLRFAREAARRRGTGDFTRVVAGTGRFDSRSIGRYNGGMPQTDHGQDTEIRCGEQGNPGHAVLDLRPATGRRANDSARKAMIDRGHS